MSKQQQIFWLHIKKSAGQSTRLMLGPYYTVVDRNRCPANFIQSNPRDWNDILNNWRTPLGTYQFKRCLFAREFLWKETYDALFKFAFCRNPLDRCISQFFYLWEPAHRQKPKRKAPHLTILHDDQGKKPLLGSRLHYHFDCFLDAVAACRDSDSNNHPQLLHFQTHSAEMWSDITDQHDNLLVDRVWRLDDLAEGINHVRALCGGPAVDVVEVNTTKRKPAFTPTDAQRTRIETLFSKDFDLYENL